MLAPVPEQLSINARLIDYFVLSWFDAQMRHQQRRIATSTLSIADAPHAQNIASISVSVHGYTPIMLMPVANNGVRFSPAAALFPASNAGHSRRLVLEWERGCAVALLFRAFIHTNGLYGFNAPRYLQEITDNGLTTSCWIDDETILALLKERTLRVTAIRERATHPLAILFPAGTWNTSNVFDMAFTSNGRTLQQLQLPYGISHFFDVHGCQYMRVYIDEREVVKARVELPACVRRAIHLEG